MTYRQAYQEFLERALTTGGTPGQMKTAADEYNAVGNPDYTPTDAFSTFLRTTNYFSCTTCGFAYKLLKQPKDVAGSVLLDRETVCECCEPST